MPIRNPQIRWLFPEPISVPANFQLAVGESVFVTRTLYQRGLTSPEDALAFLDPNHYSPSPSSDLPFLDKASKRIISAINKKEQMLIWGDFDVDGQTSTTLLVSALRDLGAIITHYIPVRSKESHGISLPALSEIINEVSPRLIITCDTGVDANQEVDYLNRAGIDIIITDHHQLPHNLPNALAVINPNFLPIDHALRNLPGVGVAYKLIEDIYENFSKDPSHLLDLVALGIVADVAVQSDDTRFLLQKGLEVLRESPRPGLLEVYRKNSLTPDQINEEHIGYIIGPRLNALGRLADANSCVEFFTSNNPERITILAKRLEELNSTRQVLTQEIYHEAVSMIEAYPDLVEEFPILVLQGSPKWNPGVIGIVASRLVERYHKPVIMLSQDGDIAKGSARSIPGVPIAELISTCEDLLNSHGGHPMAAGMSLPLSNISQFRRSLAANFHKSIGDQLPEYNLQIDLEIPFHDISVSFINDFQRLAPFGAGNPKLTFATRGVFTAKNQIRKIGRTGNHRRITFTDSNGDMNDLLWWNSSDLTIPQMPLDIAYTLEISTYRDQPQVQATLLHLRQSPESPVYITTKTDIQAIDLRNTDNPQAALTEHFSPESSIIWAENQLPQDFPSSPRSKLSHYKTLIVWTTPPSKYILSHAVDQTSPSKVILVGIDPPLQSLDDFVQSLLGLIKHQKMSGKPFSLIRYSEALALPEDIIEVGLEWIHQKGVYDLDKIHQGQIESGPGRNLPGFSATDKLLKHKLREIISYRKYFKNAHIRAIL